MKAKIKKESAIGIIIGIMAAIIFALTASIVSADEESYPQGPDTITVTESGRFFNASGPTTLQAKAGNVSALVIDHRRVTEAWQGYYGNITGTITLDDAYNFTMYDWSMPDPQGEIYASNGTNVKWANIFCMNTSGTRNVSGGEGDVYYFTNASQIELDFGINITDKDGLNETFNDTFDGSFRVGSITIDSDDGCSETHPFLDEGHNTDWDEVLLSDNTSIIFTAVIRENADMFQPGSDNTADFQLLVLENGHAGSEEQTTPYYFYVELS